MAKIVVIGANHAGTACINTILDNYPGHEVIVYDKNDNISFLGCGMALWIGNQINGSEGLFYSDKQTLEAKGAKVHLKSQVTHVDFANKTVYGFNNLGDFSQEYDKLVLATGSIPAIPQIEGIDLENIQVVKLFQNAQDVIDKIHTQTINNVCIVGAGYIGVELAEAFRLLGKNVTIIDGNNDCLSNYYDPEFTQIMNHNLQHYGINTCYNEKVVKFMGENGYVNAVVTDTNTYPADMVILAMGFKPNSFIGSRELELFANGAYVVDKHQKTSMDDVYAIGDCATVYDNSINDINYIALATNAVRSGIVAAHNVCGTDLESNGVQGSNGINIFDYKMVSTGLTKKKALKLGFNAGTCDYSDLQKPAFMTNNNHNVNIRIVYDKDTNRILGAQMASHHDMSMGIHMFSLAIQEQLTLDRIQLLDILFLPHFNQPYNYITMASLNPEK